MFAKQSRTKARPIAVIDTETTGVYWTAHDRIIELGIVLISPEGEIIETYETLVNPERDLGPTHIHGIDAEACIVAPRFKDIAGDILELLRPAGAIAGHNVVFDARFLCAEYERLGVPLRRNVQTLCTYQLTRLSLHNACEQYGICFAGSEHSAMADARATADLVRLLAAEGVVDLAAYRTPLEFPPCDSLHTATVTRPLAQKKVDVRSGFLADLTDRVLYDINSTDDVALEYLSLLRRVLEDRVLDGDERNLLLSYIDEKQIPEKQLRDLHQLYLDAMAVEAWTDGILTDNEMKDLRRMARLLDLEPVSVDQAIARAQQAPPQASSPKSSTGTLSGASVCFTGAIISSLNGEVITRKLATELAENAGLVVKNGVTKKLDMLIVADPDTQSGKAKKAREYGTRIVAERDFWPMIGVAVT